MIEKLPDGDYTTLHTYRNRRNRVELIVVDGKRYVFKQFARPTLFNRIVYTFVRPGKARRGYQYALRLQSMGFDTPTPVAYMVAYRHCLVDRCYLLTEYYDYPLMETVKDMDIESAQTILAAFAAFTVDLHTHGVLHRDYNYGNVMYHFEGDKVLFALIDVNRMRFGRLSRRRCIENLRFSIGNVHQTYLVEQYALLRGWSSMLSITVNYMIRLRNSVHNTVWHRIKNFAKKQLRLDN